MKIIAVAIIVALAVVFIAHTLGAGANFAAWMMKYVLKPLYWLGSQLSSTKLASYGIGTPVFNPNASGGLKGITVRWQDETHVEEVVKIETACKNNYPEPDGPLCPGGSWWKKVLKGVKKVLDFGIGVRDSASFGLHSWAINKIVRGITGNDKAGIDTNSTAYRNGNFGGDVVLALTPTPFGKFKLLRWGGKFAIHTSHHTFKIGRFTFGRFSHLQLNVWTRGVRNSGRTIFRIPIFIKKWPKKEKIIFRW